jgi:DNA-binding transcriptional LysR family regulator
MGSRVMPADPRARPDLGDDRIELRLLRYFLAVSEERHFGRAAKRLNMTQPPLSRAIRNLENRLGVELIDRTHAPIGLTPAGHALATQARKVLADLDFAVAEARRAGGVASPLRVGCMLHVPLPIVHQFVSVLEQRQVGPAEVRRVPSLEQVEMLRARRLDLGILPGLASFDDIETEPLLPAEPMVAIVARDHPLAGEDVVGPDDLERYPQVVYPDSQVLTDGLLDRLGAAGYRFPSTHPVTSVNDAGDVLLAVAGTSAVAMLTDAAVENTGLGSIVAPVSLDPPVAGSETLLAWAADPPRHVAQWLGVIREIAREFRPAPESG